MTTAAIAITPIEIPYDHQVLAVLPILPSLPLVCSVRLQADGTTSKRRRTLHTCPLRLVPCERRRHVREVRKEGLVVGVHTVSQHVVWRDVECRRERRRSSERAYLDVDDVVAETAAVGEPIELACEQAQTVRRRRRRNRHVQANHL